MDTRASRYAMWRLHAPPSREADINPNPQKGGYPAPDRVTFLTGPNRDFPKRRRHARHDAQVRRDVRNRLYHSRLSALKASLPILIEHLEKCWSMIRPHSTAERLKPTNRRNLCDDAFHPPIMCRDLEDVAARIASAENTNPRLVDVAAERQVCNRVPIATALEHGIRFLTRFAIELA